MPQEHVLAPTVLSVEVGHEHVQYVALQNVQIVKKTADRVGKKQLIRSHNRQKPADQVA